MSYIAAYFVFCVLVFALELLLFRRLDRRSGER